MKPEHRLDHHVDGTRQIVAAPDVAQLMYQDRSQLLRREGIHNAVRQQQNRSNHAEHARLAESR
jgi:hypothetical protein